MENPHCVNSPRRILSFSKRKRTLSFLHHNPNQDQYQDHGPKTSEVYGFVGSITTVVATVIFFVWAYLPESWLHSLGLFYYPNRYWALAAPTYAMVAIVLALGFYLGINFMSTPPPTSFNTIFDEFSREPSTFVHSRTGDERPIEPIADLGIHRVNFLMFSHAQPQESLCT